MSEEKGKQKKNITILLSGGRLPVELLGKVDELAKEYSFEVYLSTVQNLRLACVPEEHFEKIRAELVAAGADLKAPGRFPKPKVCVGSPSCNLGLVDTEELGTRIWQHFGSRTNVKQKIKIAISACPAACSNALLADIGAVATRSGYDIYVGGKGGARPRVGQRIVRQADEERLLEVIGILVDFHDRKTSSKQRMFKLLDDPEFPFSVES